VKLLVVDDDPSIRLLATEALESRDGFCVSCASTGQEGFQQALDEPPDLILLDQMLPDMAGSQLLERLRREPATEHQAVVFFTATSSDADLAALRRLGAAGVIRKPFNPEELPDQVTRLLATHCQNRTAEPTVDAESTGTSVTDDLRTHMFALSRMELTKLHSMLRDEGTFDPVAAGQIAHRWVGRGGTYGYPEMTALGQRAEALVALFPSHRDELMATLEALEQLFQTRNPQQVLKPYATESPLRVG
jgi:DNA-binding response OmpR family regulator